QFVVRQIEQCLQRDHLLHCQEPLVPVKVAGNQDVVFEQAPPRPPTQPTTLNFPENGVGHRQTSRRTSIARILRIARVGLSAFGQTSTQFMIVWQRNSRYGSFRLSSRSLVARSREAAMKRYAWSKTA